nr:carboxylesterase family protein [Cryobacterium sp. TMT2-15-1]
MFGESAGANAVLHLMATPSAAELFARAIAQSPPTSASFPHSLTDGWAAEFVAELRPQRPDASALSPNELLTTAAIADLTQAAVALQARTPDANPGTFCMIPVIDGHFLPERPLDAFRHGTAHRVPLIIGTNERQGSLFRGRVDILPKSPTRIAAIFDHAPVSSHDAMRSVYASLPAKRSSSDFGEDFVFWYPSLQIGDFHSRVAPVFTYRFDLAPRLTHMLGIGATHGIELFALFDHVDGPTARAMSLLRGRELFINAGERMRLRWLRWLRFACTGRPDDTWPTYSETDRLTLIIDEVDRIESDPRAERRAVWQEFLPNF